MTNQKFGINYNGSSTGYIVFELNIGRIVFKSESKSECIAKAQQLNGWVVDGSEQTYATQRDSHG